MNDFRCHAAVFFATWFLLAPGLRAADPPAAEAEASRPAWEHLAFTHDLRGNPKDPEVARTINRLGREGWELVSVANFNEEGTTTKTTYYFKRRL